MPATLPFDPACRALLIGGLPHRSAVQAVDVTRRITKYILTWPQLPQRNPREQALRQAVAGFPGLVISSSGRVYVDRARAVAQLDTLALAHLQDRVSYGQLDEEHASGLYELLRQQSRTAQVLGVKAQLLGPVSAATQLTDERQVPLIYDAPLREALAQHVRLRAMWLESQLSSFGLPTIVTLDEPFLDALGQPFLPVDWTEARALIDSVLGALSGVSAIYTTGMVALDELLECAVTLVVVDVCRPGTPLTTIAGQLEPFLQDDGALALGVMPIDGDELVNLDGPTLARRCEAHFAALAAAGMDETVLRRRCFIAPCGPLARLDEATAEHALSVLAEASELLRYAPRGG